MSFRTLSSTIDAPFTVFYEHVTDSFLGVQLKLQVLIVGNCWNLLSKDHSLLCKVSLTLTLRSELFGVSKKLITRAYNTHGYQNFCLNW